MRISAASSRSGKTSSDVPKNLSGTTSAATTTWVHTQKDAIPAEGAMAIERRYAMRGNNPPELLDGPVRSLTADVGKMIMKYGFEKGAKNPPQAGPWDPAYRTALTWSRGMVAATTMYNDLGAKLIAARQQLRDLEKRKSEAMAKGRWDKA